MIHGTGGGFDQGVAFSRRLIEAGCRIIAPSRFGYLRSAYPSEPSSENQADAFVDLLDELSIDRVAVVGGSAGALSALQFAIRHPQRCAALVPVVPAAYAPDHTPQPPSLLARAIMEYALKSDFLFWSGLQRPTCNDGDIARDDPDLVAQASADERERRPPHSLGNLARQRACRTAYSMMRGLPAIQRRCRFTT